MTTAGSSNSPGDMTITEHELQQCEEANATGRPPVVFVHGLWLLPSSWDRWAGLFGENGYVALTPGWPDDPETVEEAKAHPELFAGKSIGQVADHFEEIIRGLTRKPAIIGHSFGGLLTQSPSHSSTDCSCRRDPYPPPPRACESVPGPRRPPMVRQLTAHP